MAGRVNDRIDPNSAEWYELAQLPGVGETIARRIVAERESRRAAGKPGFGSAGDLDCVPGIGPAMLHRISRHVGPGPRGASIDRVEGGG
jgi:competence protein ComEA